jgi:hypothetical protein
MGPDDFEKKIADLNRLTSELQTIKADLSRFRVPLSDLGWLNQDQVYYRPLQPRNAALLDTVVSPVSVPSENLALPEVITEGATKPK